MSFSNYEDAGITIPSHASDECRTTCPECSHTRNKSSDKCLSVNVDKGTWYCHHCTWADGLKDNVYPPGNRNNRATRPAKRVSTPDSGCAADCTLDAYASAKRLPVEFLKTLRLSDTEYQGKSAIYIPYRQKDGSEGAVRIRAALEKRGDTDKRFRWKSGKPFLYGLWRLKDEPVVLVEGESDCHTLWYHGFNAIGLPGATQWKDLRDSAELTDCDEVFAVIEPDEGGERLLKSLERSSIKDKLKVIRLGSDVSELHIAASDSVKTTFREALKSAIPIGDELERLKREESEKAFEQCKGMAQDQYILERFSSDVRSAGLVGEERNARIVFLAFVSRLLDKIISVVVKGPSSGGKSFSHRERQQVLSPVRLLRTLRNV